MKKYLINGALALLAGAFLVCCAEKESDFVPLAQQKAMDFEEVFKEIYGEIDPYQDWGFKSGKIEIDPNDSSVVVEVEDVDGDIAYTRVAPFGGNNYLLAFNGGTRGANPNKNQWGNPNYGHYKVPPALTDGQCKRVKAYFQQNPYLTFTPPTYEKYFVQQVYKGGTDVGPNSLSKEYYKASNGDTIDASGHMDKLTVSSANEHVFNFNYGTYNGGKPHDVLNTGATDENNPDNFHKDMITLMEGPVPTCVGYHETYGQIQHNDHAALVSAAVIDAWAEANRDKLIESGEYGEAVNDDWHRDFVGLDYEAKPLNDVLVKNSDGSQKYAKISDYDMGKDYVWTGTTVLKYSDVKDQFLLTAYNKKVPVVSINMNQYLGEGKEISQSELVTKVTGKQIHDAGISTDDKSETREYDALNLAKVYELLGTNGYAVNGSKEKFVKNIGGRDYVYSDWIVTLTNAGQTTITDNTFVTYLDIWTQKESGRVFCEDLGKASREDLDYNDVVFDVTIWENYTYRKEWWEKYSDGVRVDSGLVANVEGEDPKQIPETRTYYANVNLLAAGGTIPITVAGQPVHVQFNPNAAVETMINTRDNNSTAYGSYATYDPVQLNAGANTVVKRYRKVKNVEEENQDLYELKLFEIVMPVDSHAIITIPIISSFGEATQVQTIEGKKGEIPRKFMVPNDLPNHPERMWTSERKNISLAYPKFKDWVNGKITLDSCFFGANSVNTNYTYQGKDYVGNKLPLVMKAQRTIVTDGEQYLWSGTIEYGDVWNLKNTEASLVSNQTEEEESKQFKEFYAGDRLRFRATGIKPDAWISVAVGNIKPYFVDSEFPNYVYNADGSKETREDGCVEVLLDEASAAKLNENVSNGKITFQVQGRNFTLTGITRVLFQ